MSPVNAKTIQLKPGYSYRVIRPFQTFTLGTVLEILSIRYSSNSHEGLAGFHLICPEFVVALEENKDADIIRTPELYLEEIGTFDSLKSKNKFQASQKQSEQNREKRLKLKREELRQEYLSKLKIKKK